MLVLAMSNLHDMSGVLRLTYLAAVALLALALLLAIWLALRYWLGQPRANRPPLLLARELLARLGWFYGLTLGVALAALWAFQELADEVLDRDAAAFNREVLLWIHGHAGPDWDAAMVAATQFGSAWAVLLIGACLGGWLVYRRRVPEAATLAAVLGGGALLTFGLKLAFRQARPQLFTQLLPEAGYSFPSGHTLIAFCLYGFAAALAVAPEPRRPWRWLLALACLLLAALVGFSRMYLGVHWPTDVVASVLVAAFWVSLCLAGQRRVAGR